MREVLGAGRGVQAGEVESPAMAAEAGRETRWGAESDEESDGCDGAQDSERVRVRNTYYIHPNEPVVKTDRIIRTRSEGNASGSGAVGLACCPLSQAYRPHKTRVHQNPIYSPLMRRLADA